jgi:hypothetical protein
LNTGFSAALAAAKYTAVLAVLLIVKTTTGVPRDLPSRRSWRHFVSA